jgi:hypothetical protein
MEDKIPPLLAVDPEINRDWFIGCGLAFDDDMFLTPEISINVIIK